jgi:Protein of unknown function (DUF2829)
MTKETLMQLYIGTKMIKATPMNRADYNALRGWEVPSDENPADEGYLVEYVDGGKANHPDFKGYISWSPAQVFELAYRQLDAMTFGDAICLLKQGQKVARLGWNGKGMWLILVPGTPAVNFTEGSAYMKAGLTHGEILPHIDMYTVNAEGRRAMLPGWLASQSDMLAEDWVIVL